MPIRCPYRIRPRDFDALESYAETHPAMAEMAEQIAWDEDGTFSWALFFAALREFRTN